MKAFILMKTRTGEIRDVVKLARRIPGVKECNMTFGPYDAVAIVEADDVQRLGRIIATEIQPIPGIVETLTCLAIELA